MNSMHDFDVIVIGAGAAGISAAQAAREQGANVCLIEREIIGGECPNWACIPTKALLHSAKLYRTLKNDLPRHGIHAKSVGFDFAAVMRRKQQVVDAISSGGKRVEKALNALGVQVEYGAAYFTGANELQVDELTLTARSFVVATGAREFIPPIDGLAELDYWTFRDAVSTERLPGSLAIIGGGPVGCEFATIYQSFGTQVSLFDIGEHILGREDAEIATLAQKTLQDIGTSIHVRTKVLSVEQSDQGFVITYQQGDESRQSKVVECLLVASGKRANIEGLNLEKAGVALDDRGRVKLNDSLQSSQSHIYFAGDVSGGMLFTHTAHVGGAIAGYNAAMQSYERKRDLSVVPRATFIDPEVASVGMTLTEAVEAGKSARVYSHPIGALGRAVTEGERVGLMKIVVETDSGLILGGHMIGPHAGEVIHELALAMHVDATIDQLGSMLHAFPTYSEIIPAALP